MRKALAIFASLFFTNLYAQTAAPLPNAGGSVLQMLLGLGLVIACLYGALHFLRRMNLHPTRTAQKIKIVGAASVGQRERVVMLEIGSQILVVGVAPGRISRLGRLNKEELAIEEPQELSHSKVGDFASRLRQFMEPKKREE